MKFLSWAGCSCTFITEVALGTEVSVGVVDCWYWGRFRIHIHPDRGRSRRALLCDKTASAYRGVLMSVARARFDLANRVHGLITNATSIVQERAGDGQLVARVRAKIGRLISYPHAVDGIARDGRITGAQEATCRPHFVGSKQWRQSSRLRAG